MSSPETSILSFSQRCGSGVKGANPSVSDSTINIDRGIRLNRLCMVGISGAKGDFNSPDSYKRWLRPFALLYHGRNQNICLADPA